MIKKDNNIETMSSADLSRFWYCTNDKTKLRPKTEKVAHNPYFKVNKINIEISLNNAVAIRKIPSHAIEQAKTLAQYMFDNSELKEVELVGTECAKCQNRYASPKLYKVDELKGVNIGRALYDNEKLLATKDYGRFRFVDHFGMGRGQNQGGGRRGMRNILFLGWFIGFGAIFAVFFLFYILGLEMKLGKKYIPLGPILLITVLLGILFFLASNSLLNPILDLFKSFTRGR